MQLTIRRKYLFLGSVEDLAVESTLPIFRFRKHLVEESRNEGGPTPLMQRLL